MESGARMGILMGDVRRNGHLYSMLTDIVKPGELEQIIIKQQHNCVSNGRSYTRKNFVPLVHEYIMVLKKAAPYILSFQYPFRKELDIRDSVTATWRDVVFATLTAIGGEARLSDIYAAIGGYKKAASNPHWKDKVRQVLQMYSSFYSRESGVWAIAA